ncbi:MAG: heme ABC transporter ATP-binding protein [Janthinobacterium lividum]
MLNTTNLTYRAGPKTLLQNISLTAQPGELLVVVGANGAGKSTLLKLLSGDLKPSGGEVKFDGKNLSQWQPAMLARRRAVLTQQHTLALAFQVRELVLLGRYPHFGGQPIAHDHAVVAAALDLVGLRHLAEREYPTLSGGEQQRAQLARVLAQVWEAENGFLLLDEPLTGLDLRHQHQTLAVARQLTRRGFGVVAVLHDLNLAAQYADQVLLLHQGRAVASGIPAEVFTPDYIQLGFGIEVELLAHPSLGHPLIVPTVSTPF